MEWQVREQGAAKHNLVPMLDLNAPPAGGETAFDFAVKQLSS